MTENVNEPDTTDPKPADLEHAGEPRIAPDDQTVTNIDGDPAGDEHPGAPTAEDLAADRNLFPGAEKPLSVDAPEESGDHTDEA